MRKTEFYGRKALIINKRYHQCGQTGICLGAVKTPLGWQMKFRQEGGNGHGVEFYVRSGADVKWIK